MLASSSRMTVKASRLRPLLVWSLLCWSPFSSGASAQIELRRGVAGEDEIVEVNVVNIDVSVTDRQGDLIAGPACSGVSTYETRRVEGRVQIAKAIT